MGLADRISRWFRARKEQVLALLPERNEPCRCGSGKKYKHCHLLEDEKKKAEERLRLIHCGPT